MKKFLSVIIILIMVLSVNVTFAENETKCTKCGAINHTVDMCPCVDVYINGELLETAKQKAEIVEGRTLVPLRAVCEELGCSVIWKNNIRYAYIDNPLTRVAVGLEVDYITVWDERQNNRMAQRVETDVPAQFVNGHTMVPLNVIASALHAEVKWHNSDRIVSIKTEYSEIVELENEENLFAAKKDGAWIVLDSTGNELLENPPVEITELADKLIAVKKIEEGKEKFYVIRYGIEDVIENGAKNTKLSYKTTGEYDYCGEYSFGDNCVKIAKENGNCAFLDLTDFMELSEKDPEKVFLGEKNIYPDAIGAFSNGFAIVNTSVGGGYYYIDKDGNQCYPISDTCDDAKEFKDGYAAVKKKDGKWGFIKSVITDGKKEIKEIESPGYDDVRIFANGYAEVKLGDKRSFIKLETKDSTTKIIETDSHEYEVVKDFVNGYAAVKKDEKWGFITIKTETDGSINVEEIGTEDIKDVNGIITKKFKYDDVRDFYNGYAAVKKGEKWTFINDKDYKEASYILKKDGVETLVYPTFEDVKTFNGVLAEVKENGKWTFVDFGKRE